MKNFTFILMGLVLLLNLASCGPAATGLGTVSISFNMRLPPLLSGVGSNDESVLVWVVDSNGAYVKTLEYYHGWASNGLPGEGVTTAWTSDRNGNTDGVSSATVHLTNANSPLTWTLGAHTTTFGAPSSWDCLDAAGAAVAAGNYTVKIAVLRRGNGTFVNNGTNYFLHSASIAVGSGSASAIIPSTGLDTSGNTGEDPSVPTGNGGTVTFTPL